MDWLMKVFQNIETLPVLLINYLWSREQKWYRGASSCRRRTGTVVPRAEHFGDLITADHKVLSEECESRNNHRYVVV